MPPGMVTTTPSVLSWAKSVPRRKTDWLIENGVQIQFVEEGLTSLDGMGLLLLEGAYLFVEIEKEAKLEQKMEQKMEHAIEPDRTEKQKETAICSQGLAMYNLSV